MGLKLPMASTSTSHVICVGTIPFLSFTTCNNLHALLTVQDTPLRITHFSPAAHKSVVDHAAQYN
jgi:hypothetical protein